jgi:hypothetical protein
MIKADYEDYRIRVWVNKLRTMNTIGLIGLVGGDGATEL